MPTLAEIYSMIDSAKRRAGDVLKNPYISAQQMLGNANDRARVFNELNDAALDEFRATGDLYGPKGKELAQSLAGAYNPVGMINQPLKGSKLVQIPIDMIEHGEAVMPGGTLTFPGARKKIEEFAKKETPIPPIDVVSAESGKPWMVVDGSHRLEAAKLKGAKTIPAYVSPHDKEGLEQIAKYKMVAKEAELPTQINPAELKARKAIDDLVNQAKYFGVDSPIDHTQMPVGTVMAHLDDYLGRSQQVANLSPDAITSLRNLWYKAEDAAKAYKRVYGENKLMGKREEAANESTKRFKFNEKKLAKSLKNGEMSQEEYDNAIAYNKKYFSED